MTTLTFEYISGRVGLHAARHGHPPSLVAHAFVGMVRSALLQAIHRIVQETPQAGIDAGQFQRNYAYNFQGAVVPHNMSTSEEIILGYYIGLIEALRNYLDSPYCAVRAFFGGVLGYDEWHLFDAFYELVEDGIWNIVRDSVETCSDHFMRDNPQRFFIASFSAVSRYSAGFAVDALARLCDVSDHEFHIMNSLDHQDVATQADSTYRGQAAGSQWPVFFHQFANLVFERLDFLGNCRRLCGEIAADLPFGGNMRAYLAGLTGPLYTLQVESAYPLCVARGTQHHTWVLQHLNAGIVPVACVCFETNLVPTPAYASILHHLWQSEQRFLFAAFCADIVGAVGKAETMYAVLGRLLRARIDDGVNSDLLLDGWWTRRRPVTRAVFGTVLILLLRPGLLSEPTSSWDLFGDLTPRYTAAGVLIGHFFDDEV